MKIIEIMIKIMEIMIKIIEIIDKIIENMIKINKIIEIIIKTIEIITKIIELLPKLLIKSPTVITRTRSTLPFSSIFSILWSISVPGFSAIPTFIPFLLISSINSSISPKFIAKSFILLQFFTNRRWIHSEKSRN